MKKFHDCLLSNSWKKEAGGNFWSDLPGEVADYASKVANKM